MGPFYLEALGGGLRRLCPGSALSVIDKRIRKWKTFLFAVCLLFASFPNLVQNTCSYHSRHHSHERKRVDRGWASTARIVTAVQSWRSATMFRGIPRNSSIASKLNVSQGHKEKRKILLNVGALINLLNYPVAKEPLRNQSTLLFVLNVNVLLRRLSGILGTKCYRRHKDNIAQTDRTSIHPWNVI